jgi:acetate kinase
VRVLVLNPGSSSLKASVIEAPGDRTLLRRATTWGAEPEAVDRRREVVADLVAQATRTVAGDATLEAIGYRVVHGGTTFRATSRVDDSVLRQIDALDELAPLHNRIAAETIRTARGLWPDLPHVACFDTAFHAALDEAAWRYPVPAAWHARWGIRRFGFHGISVGWAAQRIVELLSRPASDLQVVVAHLGAGSSVTAVAGGRSVATSMGFTPLEGLMMGTRSGSIDPGIVLHLLRRGMGTQMLADALEHESGLLGVSGRSADVAELERLASAGNADAALAIEMFARRAAAGIASVATALQRIDALVFTGGIGEHAANIRMRICELLAVLAAPLPSLDVEAGTDGLLAIRPFAVAVIHAREDIVIARQVAAL